MVEGALPVGGVDRPYLQSAPAAMRLIAFITEGTQIRKILDHMGVDSELPHIAPARGPPLWGDCDAQTDDGAQIEPAGWDLAAQPATDYEIDQRVSW